jgi:hypothetical protein
MGTPDLLKPASKQHPDGSAFLEFDIDNRQHPCGFQALLRGGPRTLRSDFESHAFRQTNAQHLAFSRVPPHSSPF